ncbi:hypothetical protein MP638_001627 [Amoeboaphelidium occidentale]|nr:hypothetical protein MP638_001627 [Amoeboaphelidium occidentale]
MKQIFNISEEQPYLTPAFKVPPSKYHNTPIVIDHGSWQTRAGFSKMDSPCLQFDNLLAKVKDKNTGQNVIVVGKDIESYGEKGHVRNAFDGSSSVVVHGEMLEHELEYIFSNLGFKDAVKSPVLMTETLCNPAASRQVTYEVLFECYNVPHVTYGVDAVYSCAFNGISLKDGGIIISMGHNATTLMPFFDGKIYHNCCKRISLGGSHASDFMLKLMQLKYPNFPTKMTLEEAQILVNHHTHIPENFFEELHSFENVDSIEEKEHIIQFPYTEVMETSEENAQEIEQRREQQRERMKKHVEQQRLKKLETKERELSDLISLKETKEEDPDSFATNLLIAGYETEKELDTTISSAQAAIRKIKNKMEGVEDEEPEIKETPSFPLVDIPDSELDDEQKREKKKQRLMKANYDAREKARQEKEAQQAALEEKAKLEEEKRLADPKAYIEDLYSKRTQILDKIKEKNKQSEAMNDRKSKLAQNRMKKLVGLADDGGLTAAGTKKRTRKEDDDGFGMSDEDWMVYYDIKKGSEEEELQELEADLENVENLLTQYDPEFSPDDIDMQTEERNKSLFYILKYGRDGYLKHDDIAAHHQIRMNVERIRVPEIFFQPSICGVDEAGIIETLQTILSQFTKEQQSIMVNNIFITGTNSIYPGIVERVESEVRAFRPFKSQFGVTQAKDPRLDAWRGAAQWVRNLETKNQIPKVFVSYEEYMDNGPEYLVRLLTNENCF